MNIVNDFLAPVPSNVDVEKFRIVEIHKFTTDAFKYVKMNLK